MAAWQSAVAERPQRRDEQFTAWKARGSQSSRQLAVAASLYLALIFYPVCEPLAQTVLTPRAGLPIVHT